MCVSIAPSFRLNSPPRRHICPARKESRSFVVLRKVLPSKRPTRLNRTLSQLRAVVLPFDWGDGTYLSLSYLGGGGGWGTQAAASKPQQLTCEKCQKTFGSVGGWRYHTTHSVCDAKPADQSSEEAASEQDNPVNKAGDKGKGNGKGKGKGKDSAAESTSRKPPGRGGGGGGGSGPDERKGGGGAGRRESPPPPAAKPAASGKKKAAGVEEEQTVRRACVLVFCPPPRVRTPLSPSNHAASRFFLVARSVSPRGATAVVGGQVS